MFVLQEIGKALSLAFAMFWQVLWPLALGFLLSAVVEALVSKQTISRLLGKDRPREVAIATALGAASSCSYAAVAVARTLFRKGATLGNAIIFEFASTNLVFELGLVLLILLGWQFLSAELLGGLVMVVLLAIVFKVTLSKRLVSAAHEQAERGLSGRMEGHGAMDMSVTDGPLLQRAFSGRALTSIAHYFFMNIYGLWTDLVLGFLIAGALGSWVSDSVWSRLFLEGHGLLSEVWGALIGPLVAVVSFVCSVGNVPLAAVLWRGGISLRRRDRLHLRRPDHPPHPQHLSQVLRTSCCRLPVRRLVPDDGVGRPRCRPAVQRQRPDTDEPSRHRVRHHRLMELRHLPEHRLPPADGGAAGALPPHRRSTCSA